jgi:hypothetical protein
MLQFAERPTTYACTALTVETQGLFTGVRRRQLAGRFTLLPSAAFQHAPRKPPATAQPWHAAFTAAHRGRSRRARRGPLPAHWRHDRLLVAAGTRLRRDGAGHRA